MDKRNMEDAADGQMFGGHDLGTHRAYEFKSAEQPEVDPRPVHDDSAEEIPSLNIRLPNEDPRLGQPVWAIDWASGERRGSITGPAVRDPGKSRIVELAARAAAAVAARAAAVERAEKDARDERAKKQTEPTVVLDEAKDIPPAAWEKLPGEFVNLRVKRKDAARLARAAASLREDVKKAPGTEPKLLDPTQPSWMKKHDFEILFKDSIDYFVVKNARLILAVNGWVVFHVFKGDAFAHQEMYPAHHIHRMKALPAK